MGEKKNTNEKWSISFMIFGYVGWSLSFVVVFFSPQFQIHAIDITQSTRFGPFQYRLPEIVVIIRTSLDAIGKIDTIPLFRLFALPIEVLMVAVQIYGTIEKTISHHFPKDFPTIDLANTYSHLTCTS